MLITNGYNISEAKNIFLQGDCGNCSKYNPKKGNIGGLYNYIEILKQIWIYIYSIFIIQEQNILNFKDKKDYYIEMKNKIAKILLFDIDLCTLMIIHFYVFVWDIFIFCINFLIGGGIQFIIQLLFNTLHIKLMMILIIGFSIFIMLLLFAWDVMIITTYITSNTIGLIVMLIHAHLEKLKLYEKNIQYQIIYYSCRTIGFIILGFSCLILIPITIIATAIIITYLLIYCYYIYIFMENVNITNDNSNIV